MFLDNCSSLNSSDRGFGFEEDSGKLETGVGVGVEEVEEVEKVEGDEEEEWRLLLSSLDHFLLNAYPITVAVNAPRAKALSSIELWPTIPSPRRWLRRIKGLRVRFGYFNYFKGSQIARECQLITLILILD